MKVTYDSNYKSKLVDKAGLLVGKGGYLLDKKTKSPIKDINGELITYSSFTGFRKGSIQYIKSDLSSLIKLSKKARD